MNTIKTRKNQGFLKFVSIVMVVSVLCILFTGCGHKLSGRYKTDSTNISLSEEYLETKESSNIGVNETSDSEIISETKVDEPQTSLPLVGKYKVTKMISRNSDGEIDSWKIYEYDKDGKNRKQIFYDSNGDIKFLYEYEYDSVGNETKSIRYDSDDNITSWTEYAYDESGN